MALLLAEAKKLSLESLQRVLVEEIINQDELFAALPFEGHDGTVRYQREKTLPAAAAIDNDGTITSSQATFDKITRDFKAIISDVEIPNMIEATQSNQGSQVATQVRLATKAVADIFKDLIINGNETVNPEEFDGLLQIQTKAGFIAQKATATGALSFDMLDELLDINKMRGNRVLYMSKRTRRSYKKLCRALGGTDPNMVRLANVGTGILVPEYEGVPILCSDNIPVTLGGGSNTVIYCLTLDELMGMTGFFPMAAGLGIKVEGLGSMETKDNTKMRVKWYTGMDIKSTKAFAFAEGVTN